MQKVVLASNNPGKVRELAELLSERDLELLPQSAFGLTEVAETGLTFVENAILKAREAAKVAGLPAIADDSGIVVDALDGQPGIYSARYAGSAATDEENLTKLLAALDGVPEEKRTARFYCLIVYMSHPADPTPIICDGTWEGRILFERRGKGGFGYDPVFYLPELGCSAAELLPAKKNALSHRGQALRALVKRIKEGF